MALQHTLLNVSEKSLRMDYSHFQASQCCSVFFNCLQESVHELSDGAIWNHCA